MSSSDATFTLLVGPHCDAPILRKLAQDICVDLCLLGVTAVDLSDRRIASTSYTGALSSMQQDGGNTQIRMFGLSLPDLRHRSQVMKEHCQVLVPIVDLSMFLFEESLYELYYALRHACLNGSLVVLPLVDAQLLHLAVALQSCNTSHVAAASALSASKLATHVPLASDVQDNIDCLAKSLCGSFVETAILDILPWIFQSCFYLTTDTSLPEITSRMINFAQRLIPPSDGSAELTVQRVPIREAYIRALSKYTTHRVNSGVTKVLAGLGGELAGQCMDAIKAIVNVDLSNCVMGDAGAKAFADVFHLLPAMRELCLRGNNIRDAGCNAVCGRVTCHPSLKIIDLSDNKITDAGVTGIYFMLESCSRVTHVCFEQNLASSTVWRQRVQSMLARNMLMDSVIGQADCDSACSIASSTLFGLQQNTIVEALTKSKMLRSDAISSLSIELAASFSEGAQPTITAHCRLDGRAASRAASISAKRGQTMEPDEGSMIEMEFDLTEKTSKHPSQAVWDSEMLLAMAVEAAMCFETSSVLVNLARINGQKLPLIFSGQRICATAVDCHGDAPTQTAKQPPLSWAGIAAMLVALPLEERMREPIPYASVAQWNPPPTREVILALTMDVILNVQKNIFSTALRSLATSQPVIQTELRMMLQGVDALNASMTSSERNTTFGGFKSAPLQGDSFTETDFLVLLATRRVAAQGLNIVVNNRRRSTSQSAAEVQVIVIGGSSTPFYRARITRCAGNISSEITSLLKLLYRQQHRIDGESISDDDAYNDAIARLAHAETDDARLADDRDASVKVRVTSKWSTGATRRAAAAT